MSSFDGFRVVAPVKAAGRYLELFPPRPIVFSQRFDASLLLSSLCDLKKYQGLWPGESWNVTRLKMTSSIQTALGAFRHSRLSTSCIMLRVYISILTERMAICRRLQYRNINSVKRYCISSCSAWRTLRLSFEAFCWNTIIEQSTLLNSMKRRLLRLTAWKNEDFLLVGIP